MESSRGSSSKAQSRHCRNIRLEEQNHDYRRNYLPFTIPSSYYNIVHVHQFTTNDTISTLINHFESCYRYSIDTESDRFTYDLSLIQVHSIPQHLPSFIVLFEINHLPPSDSSLMGKIKLLFSLLFRLGNIIFSWGSMSDELKSAIQMNLFTWPVSALCINLQDEFPGWYRRALPPCEACGSIQSSNKAMPSKSRCICTSNFPYVKSTDKWSLQNAIRYTINRFLDKSSTKKNWSIMLDPNYSPLSSSERRKRINYAIYDCFAVTLLHQAIYDKWTLTQLREAELISLFTSNAPPHFSSLSSSTLLENISEDENETKSTSLSISNALLHSSLPLSNLLEDISDDEGEDDEVFISSLSRHHDTDQLVNTTRNLSNKSPGIRSKYKSTKDDFFVFLHHDIITDLCITNRSTTTLLYILLNDATLLTVVGIITGTDVFTKTCLSDEQSFNKLFYSSQMLIIGLINGLCDVWNLRICEKKKIMIH
ncbi:unnamed protein product [Rotaria sordida]|uniref:Uncharacterized protein n=1 Tax=Rotaria sordida TaxID=392033 RepID=A0A815NSH0_9BILA|nr:unnamed protein product [Rotaria sordida]